MFLGLGLVCSPRFIKHWSYPRRRVPPWPETGAARAVESASSFAASVFTDNSHNEFRHSMLRFIRGPKAHCDRLFCHRGTQFSVAHAIEFARLTPFGSLNALAG
jgi:hypothetical protein